MCSSKRDFLKYKFERLNTVLKDRVSSNDPAVVEMTSNSAALNGKSIVNTLLDHKI